MTLTAAKKNLTATEDAFRAGTATWQELAAARKAAHVATPRTRDAFLRGFDPAREAARLGIPEEPVCRRCDKIGSECGCEPCGDFA